MILIRGAEIIDGTGSPSFGADVILKGDRISAIGDFPHLGADTVIEGAGLTLTPGFIDVNTDSDHYLTLLTHPEQTGFLLQGITTAIGGQCGSSLAPLLYGSLESIRKWADVGKINVGWQTMKEFLTVLERLGLGVNFGTLVGHSTIRRALIGEVHRDLTKNELEVFKYLVRDSIAGGALGLSTGLGYAHSRQVPFSEIKALAETAAKAHGVYATHLRDETSGLVQSIKETVSIAKETGVSVLISHFRPIRGFEKEFHNALDLLERSTNDLNINFDSYPSDTSLVSIYTLLPDWVKRGSLTVMNQSLKSPEIRERILKELPDFRKNSIMVALAPRAEYLSGRTLEEFSRNQNLKPKEGLLKLMEITQLRAVVFFRNISLDAAIQSLKSPLSITASNSPSLPKSLAARHERLANAFPKFLELALGLKLMKLEEAVRKITAVPARKFGLKERGEIKEGYYADLNILSGTKPLHVIVNGKLAVKDGAPENVLAGHIL